MITSDLRACHADLAARLRPFVAQRVALADVDDVVQEVFLRMHRGIGGLQDEERFGPWVYQVARRAIADHRRDRARHPAATTDPPEREESEPDERADETVECALGQYVIPFIAMLPSPYREALTLTEIEGLSQKDAAAMLDVSLSGMKSRVQRGRQKLRELLEECCEIALDARGRVIACEPRDASGRPKICNGC